MHNYLIKNYITQFKSLDSELFSFDELKIKFQHLLQKINYHFIPVKIPKGTKVHRIRINNGDTYFNYLSEIWAPPLDKLKLGRCNNINEQVLYVSGGGHTSLKETSPEENDLVTCLECEVTEEIHVVDIGAVQYLQRENYFQKWKKINDSGKNNIFKQNNKAKKNNKLLENFIIAEFTKEIADNQLYQYKKSAAISSFFLDAPIVQGIIYPSIKCQKKELNYAFPISEANKFLKPIRVDVLKVKFIKNELAIQYLHGCYESINFQDKMIYTKPKFVEGWASREDISNI